MLVRDREGAVLAVSRPYDPDDLGLPGGSVDPDDGDLSRDREATLRQAAARELWEECALRVDASSLVAVFEGHVGATRVTTFSPRGDVDLRAVALGARDEGRVCWATVDAVCAGTYGAYNRALFTALTAT